MISEEKDRWRNVPKRVIDCIKYLVSQNLALRGHVEVLTACNDEKIGNFLSIIKLIAEYHPILRNHLSHAETDDGAVSYVASPTQNEFIGIIAENVRSKLLRSIKRNKHYGVMFKTTPDASHRDQMSQIIRHVDVDFVTTNVEVQESFSGLI